MLPSLRWLAPSRQAGREVSCLTWLSPSEHSFGQGFVRVSPTTDDGTRATAAAWAWAPKHICPIRPCEAHVCVCAPVPQQARVAARARLFEHLRHSHTGVAGLRPTLCMGAVVSWHGSWPTVGAYKEQTLPWRGPSWHATDSCPFVCARLRNRHAISAMVEWCELAVCGPSCALSPAQRHVAVETQEHHTPLPSIVWKRPTAEPPPRQPRTPGLAKRATHPLRPPPPNFRICLEAATTPACLLPPPRPGAPPRRRRQ